MPRPRIGKVPHWDTISPSEAKELRKLEEKKKKFGVMQYEQWMLVYKDGVIKHEKETRLRVIEEAPNLVYYGEKLVSGVTMREAQMWANMMK